MIVVSIILNFCTEIYFIRFSDLNNKEIFIWRITLYESHGSNIPWCLSLPHCVRCGFAWCQAFGVMCSVWCVRRKSDLLLLTDHFQHSWKLHQPAPQSECHLNVGDDVSRRSALEYRWSLTECEVWGFFISRESSDYSQHCLHTLFIVCLLN